MEAYLALDAELTHKPETNAIDWSIADVRTRPIWQNATDTLRERILAAADRYLAHGSIDGQPFSASGLAGYRAARLVQGERGGLRIPGDRVSTLLPTMLAHPGAHDDDRAATSALLAYAVAQSPEAFLAAVLELVEREAAAHGTVFSLGRLEAVPVGAMDKALCALVGERQLPPAALAAVLETLLERGGPCAKPLALELINGRGDGERDFDLAVAAAALLYVYGCEREPATAVLATMRAEPAFGRRVVERLASRGPFHRTVPTLPDDLIGDLFLFAVGEFGWNEERWTGYDIGGWLSSLLARLRDAGTDEAHVQLERLRAELPELAWLARVSEEGEMRTLAATWRPPEPRTVIALAAARSQRYVATGDQLLETVLDALDVVQHDLARDPSGARDLWDERDGGYVPVAEPQVSSWLQRRLDEKLTGERGIILHREVQIVQPPGPTLGPRTDLHVNAVVQHRDAAAEELTTIVEVKGCWHGDVDTALETQLVDDYLRQTANRYGIYLVVWFESERWPDGDRRRAACARRERSETMRALDERAQELSEEHGLYLRPVALTVRLP
jgi:hypothetical protein